MRPSLRLLVCALAALVALPAAALTVARLVGGTNRQVAMAQAFATWAIPAYLVVLVLLGSLLVRRAHRRPRRRPVAVAGLAAGLALALHLIWFAPAVLGETPAADPDGSHTVVMTANLRFGSAEPEDVAVAVAEHGVDVLVLQEVTPAALAALESAGIAESLPHRGGRAEPGALGTVVLSRSPVTDEARLGTTMGSWVLTTGGLRVMAVHPAYPLDEDWADELAVIRDAVVAERPDVVAGDFNASRDHAPMRAILDAGLSDAVELVDAGWQPTWPTDGFWGLPLPASVAIDHVLVGRELTATDATTQRIEGTDHRALVVTVARRAE